MINEGIINKLANRRIHVALAVECFGPDELKDSFNENTIESKDIERELVRTIKQYFRSVTKLNEPVREFYNSECVDYYKLGNARKSIRPKEYISDAEVDNVLERELIRSDNGLYYNVNTESYGIEYYDIDKLYDGYDLERVKEFFYGIPDGFRKIITAEEVKEALDGKEYDKDSYQYI